MRASLKLALCTTVVGMMLTCAVLQAQELFIVANKSVSVSQLNSSELRDLFTGAKLRFSDGTRAVPVLLKGGPVHEVFLHRHVGDTPEEFRMRWRKLVFTGQGSMLKEFPSEAAMLQYVSVTPGAIGYVSRVGDPEAVKILTMQR
jgi:ABC-type phosphate transport system substrate-binding protein